MPPMQFVRPDMTPTQSCWALLQEPSLALGVPRAQSTEHQPSNQAPWMVMILPGQVVRWALRRRDAVGQLRIWG